MAKATIVCSCGVTVPVEASSRAALPAIVAGAVLGLHATKPHSEHVVTFTLDDWPAPTVSLEVECLASGCADRGNVVLLETRCALELVPAIALVFHTSHEGHPLRLRVDGDEWTSPMRP